MTTLGEMDAEQLGKIVGIFVLVGAFLFYVIARIIKGKATRAK